MPSRRCDRTYRVQHVPAVIEQHQLASILATALDYSATNIEICSLAPSLSPHEQSRYNVATVAFKDTPAVLDTDGPQWTISIPGLGKIHELVFDVDFLGFTPLNNIQDRDIVYTFVLQTVKSR